MIESLDASVGAIVSALQEADVLSNTLIVFTSDNGGYLTYGERFANISSNGPLRGQKTELYEGGHRVPTIFYWPGRILPGMRSDVGHSTDLAPTFMNLAGLGYESQDFDGVDLSGTLMDDEPLPERMLFWRIGPEKAARRGPWKWILPEGARRAELYNLDIDIGETRDLAGAYPEIMNSLEAAWNGWRASVDTSAGHFSDQL